MTTVATEATALPDRLDSADRGELVALGNVAADFLSIAVTSTGRATFYNTKAEQEAAELAVHERALDADLDLYAVLATFPGVMDRAKVLALQTLLAKPGSQDPVASQVVTHLVKQLPITRALKSFLGMRKNRVNNARTRKLILRTLLREDRIELWAVKYREKMRLCLEHALGKRRAGILKSILGKDNPTRKEMDMASKFLGGSFGGFLSVICVGNASGYDWDAVKVKALAFIFGHKGKSGELLLAFEAAKTDFAAGAILPPEVLEGIRSVYHKDIKREKVIEVTAKSGKLTETQKMLVQKRAKKADVKVEWDPKTQDAVKLYIYAFANGMGRKIAAALKSKATKAKIDHDLGKIGIVLDTSKSMEGHRTQKMRPIASALAIRDVLVQSSEGDAALGEWCLPYVNLVPKGATNLARDLIKVLKQEPDSVFVISDGYENVSAGRFAEVVERVRAMGNHVPIFHINPVMAAENKAVRQLSEGTVPTLAVTDPKALETGLLIPMLKADPKAGLLGVYKRVKELIG